MALVDVDVAVRPLVVADVVVSKNDAFVTAHVVALATSDAMGNAFSGGDATWPTRRVATRQFVAMPDASAEVATATFGAGCYWGTEKWYAKDFVKDWNAPEGAVLATSVGFMCGRPEGCKRDPTYREVCSGATGHVEVCQVKYDPRKTSKVTFIRDTNDIGQRMIDRLDKQQLLQPDPCRGHSSRGTPGRFAATSNQRWKMNRRCWTRIVVVVAGRRPGLLWDDVSRDGDAASTRSTNGGGRSPRKHPPPLCVANVVHDAHRATMTSATKTETGN